MYLFSATRGFISRVEINNHRLAFEFRKAQRPPILIFQCKWWCLCSFWHLQIPTPQKQQKIISKNNTNPWNFPFLTSMKKRRIHSIYTLLRKKKKKKQSWWMYLGNNDSSPRNRNGRWDWEVGGIRELEAMELRLWRFWEKWEIVRECRFWGLSVK